MDFSCPVSINQKLSSIIKPDADLEGLYEDLTEVEQVFIKKLALFFTGEEAFMPERRGGGLKIGNGIVMTPIPTLSKLGRLFPLETHWASPLALSSVSIVLFQAGGGGGSCV